MDTFGKSARLMLLAGCALVSVNGCTKTPAERFETYDQLKKTAPEASARQTAQKAEPGPSLASSRPASPAPPANQAKAAAPDLKTGPSVPLPNTARLEARSPVEPKAKSTPGEMPAGVEKASASVAAGPSTPKGGTVAAFQANGPSPVTGTGGAARAVTASGRKVQLLVRERTFKTEGPEGAWRVTYDDIDLLKVLNMDPVPANAAVQMPPWLKGLEGRRVRIRGFMYPTFQQTGVHAFGLARDNQICCFGRNPKIYDVFDVLLREGVTTDYLPNRPFDVVGVFHIRPDAEDGKLFHLYEMDDATVIAK